MISAHLSNYFFKAIKFIVKEEEENTCSHKLMLAI